MCSVSYNDLDAAVTECLKLVQTFEKELQAERQNGSNQKDLGDSKPIIFLGKTDLSSAFRVLPLKIRCICWLIFKAVDPRNGKVKFFVDKCLLFGASISCSHYQRFSNALKHIMQCRWGAKYNALTNYLDDFLFLAWKRFYCNQLIQKFLDLCIELNLPVAIEKTSWADTWVIFLGILMDGRSLTLSIPLEKQQKALNLLNTLASKNKATMQQLQCLTGYLNFLTKAIFA